MERVWFLAALWLALALLATLLAIWFSISTALTEIVVGTVAQLILAAVIGGAVLGTREPWVGFLSGMGAIVLTLLAGAELDPVIFRVKWKEAFGVGLAGFFAPFLGCTAVAYYVIGRLQNVPRIGWTPGDWRGLPGTRKGNGPGGTSNAGSGSRVPPPVLGPPQVRFDSRLHQSPMQVLVLEPLAFVVGGGSVPASGRS